MVLMSTLHTGIHVDMFFKNDLNGYVVLRVSQTFISSTCLRVCKRFVCFTFACNRFNMVTFFTCFACFARLTVVHATQMP